MKGILFLLFLSPCVWAATENLAQPKKDSGLEDDLLKLRDPFRIPDVVFKKAMARTELESFPVDSFKLVGVLTGPERLRAIVLTPNGKTFFVAERARIGTRGGIIRKIDPDSILVRERIVNTLGREENIDTEIRLAPENAPQTQSSEPEKSTPEAESPTSSP